MATLVGYRGNIHKAITVTLVELSAGPGGKRAARGRWLVTGGIYLCLGYVGWLQVELSARPGGKLAACGCGGGAGGTLGSPPGADGPHRQARGGAQAHGARHVSMSLSVGLSLDLVRSGCESRRRTVRIGKGLEHSARNQDVRIYHESITNLSRICHESVTNLSQAVAAARACEVCCAAQVTLKA
eukprot:1195982-Prorocentrum_minimum.AAC.6